MYQRQRRSFTPNSDDEPVPPMADDDTPPPEDRPLIRKPMGFASAFASTSSLNTYEAAPPKPTRRKAFLPGQEVFIAVHPDQPPKKRGAIKKVETKKVKHFNDAFADQTGRWRATSYDPTPPSNPPTYAGNGPYNSLFRAEKSAQQDASAPSPQTKPNQPPAAQNDTNNSAASSQPTDAGVQPVAKKGKGRKKPVKNKAANVSEPPAIEIPASVPSTSATPVESVHHATSNPADSHRVPDYHNGGQSYESHQFSRSENGVRQIAGPSSAQGGGYMFIDNTPRSEAAASQSKPYVSESELQKRANRALPVLTILIQDARSGVPDFLLAEVRVPLKRAERAEDGYWADANDICEKLQTGPSRIDGPAKVYTLRGRFRQFFLRVSADNEDKWDSANIVVTPQRTLEVFVEESIPTYSQYGPAPRGAAAGQPSPDPRRGRHYSPSTRNSPDRAESLLTTYSSHSEGYRKRQRSPSLEHHPRWTAPSSQTRSTISPYYQDHGSYDLRTSGVPPKRQRSYAKGSIDHIMMDPADDSDDDDPMPPAPPRGYHTPTPEADEDEIHEMISKSISPILEQDRSWAEFFQWKASPQTASIVLKQYRWVKSMIDAYSGKPTPNLKSRVFTIEESHVLAALHLDERWGLACQETLRLLDLYGGEDQDPRITEILNDQSTPTYNAKPIKRLLHLLREIHQQHTKGEITLSPPEPVPEQS
ncbi:hypothetical protein PTI98_006587 [Pleurotus ostreatus]|nr:hypothetical protein PTI98_006587 [Pleurotus ostreatus]